MSKHYSTKSNPRQESTRNDWLLGQVFAIPNNRLDAVTKQVVFGISQEFLRKGEHHSQLINIYYPNVAEHNGLSVESVKSSVTKLAKAGAIRKEVRLDQKTKKRHVWLAFTPEFLINPGALFEEVEESNHGGRRIKRHSGCGGEIVNFCKGCGEVDVPDSQIYYESLEEEPGGTSEENRAKLQDMDEYNELPDYHLDAEYIPDDIAEEMGVDNALKASKREIAERVATPFHIRQGATDEDLDEAFKIASEMNKEGD